MKLKITPSMTTQMDLFYLKLRWTIILSSPTLFQSVKCRPIINLCHAIKVNPLKMKDSQKVLATAKAYHLIKHDKSVPVLVSA